LGKTLHRLDAGILEGCKLLGSGTLAAGNDCTRVAHSLAGRGGDSGNIRDDWLADIGLDVGRCLFLCRAADLADHDNCFGLVVLLEQGQDIDEAGARNRVTADAHAGRLPETEVRGLFDRLVGQSSRAGDNSYTTLLVNIAWHDADLRLAGRDDAGAVWSDQAHAQFVALHLHIQHVQGRNAFGDADDQLDTGKRRFQDGVLAERGWYVDNRGLCSGIGDSLCNGVEHRQIQVNLAALAGGDTADHAGTVFNGLLGVEGTL